MLQCRMRQLSGSTASNSLSEPEYAACPDCDTILEDPQLYDGAPCETCEHEFPPADDEPSQPVDEDYDVIWTGSRLEVV